MKGLGLCSCVTLYDVAELFHQEGIKSEEDGRIQAILFDRKNRSMALRCYIATVDLEITETLCHLHRAENAKDVGKAMVKLIDLLDEFENTATTWVASELEKIEALEGKEND